MDKLDTDGDKQLSEEELQPLVEELQRQLDYSNQLLGEVRAQSGNRAVFPPLTAPAQVSTLEDTLAEERRNADAHRREMVQFRTLCGRLRQQVRDMESNSADLEQRAEQFRREAAEATEAADERGREVEALRADLAKAQDGAQRSHKQAEAATSRAQAQEREVRAAPAARSCAAPTPHRLNPLGASASHSRATVPSTPQRAVGGHQRPPVRGVGPAVAPVTG